MAEQIIVETPTISDKPLRARQIVRSTLWLVDHWLLVFSTVFGAAMIAPFLAPVFMHLGWTGPAQFIYSAYSLLCHQMAQRSIFLFGSQPMYNIAQLPVVITGNEATDTLALRAFFGNADLGWKVAWSDRMVYMYGGIWLAGMLYGLLRWRPVKTQGIALAALLLIPMAVDGGTHFLSDLAGGLTGGFRYNNQWLANLTGNSLPTWFYMGDAFGSFNSTMRLISGLGFGFALTWLTFPHIDKAFQEIAEELRAKLAKTTMQISQSGAFDR